MELQVDELQTARLGTLKTKWIEQVEKAKRREKGYRKMAKTACELYDTGKSGSMTARYNILYSNTETLLPALYNSLPKPEVRHKLPGLTPETDISIKLLTGVLNYQLDTDQRDTPSFDSLMSGAVLGALVPARGIVRWKYVAETQVEEPAGEVEEGEEAASEETAETLKAEYLAGELVPWDKFCCGYALTWEETPWICFEHLMTKEELVSNFGEEVAATVNLGSYQDSDTSEEGRERMSGEATSEKASLVYEIWDKTEKRVLFISPDAPLPLKLSDDPYGLSGFYPMPKPLTLTKVTKGIPMPLYEYYREQVEELNVITNRIRHLIASMRLRGVYDSNVEGLSTLLTAEENTMQPCDNVAALQGGALEKALWMVPIDKHITVLASLYNQREAIKQIIYEITGIADIMRGSSVASETLGAQQIKNQWGTLRLKRSQREVAAYAKECLRIVGELAVSCLSPETLLQMTGLELPTRQQKQQIGQLAATSQQLPPELQASMQQPAIEDVLERLQNDTSRSYLIDIETNSTIDTEASEDKQDFSELTNALAQFFNGVSPAVKDGTFPWESMKVLLVGIVKRFRLGREVELQLQNMQPPQPPAPPAPDPTEMAQKELDMKLAQQKAASEERKAQQEELLLQMELELAKAQHEFKMEELRMQHLALRDKYATGGQDANLRV